MGRAPQAYGSAKEANPSSPDLVATTHCKYEEDAVPGHVIVLKHEAGESILVPRSVFGSSAFTNIVSGSREC